ncbi:UDP-N-acetylmuramate dehydrogenase [Fulvivirga maritima]|uniref:UDP-N-acetylmuramate dehydrogenase n=1 Tax=Fulvivirga maritima TaxID=2904247 RepID=UPI001F27FE71|nr:UDP-N-acetylmuramate dehydrogenase [Fulvivirga maritima]UII27951.1 UDP-N-acetylmuramate dehydrogenase [Fulvivirga maritima]
MKESIEKLEKLIPDLKRDIDLSNYTTWKIGGKAKYFWFPVADKVADVISFCYQNGIKVYFLGRGSNVLIDDKGLDGLVICTKKALRSINNADDFIIAESGVPLPMLAKYAAKLGCSGYEFLIGIPGTVGGGIVMNAGLTARTILEIGELLVDIEAIDNMGNQLTLVKDDLQLGYRYSSILGNELFILSARFRMGDKSDANKIKERTLFNLKDRKAKQPLTKATAGSTFKQPAGGKSAGWYIDKAGLKGYRCGTAVVSEKHANWIEVDKNASSKDVRSLMQTIQVEVKAKFSIDLEPEVIFLT